MSPEQIPEPWRSFLSELNEQLSESVALYCLGGFAITIAYGLPRPTAEMDVCDVIPDHATSEVLGLARRGSALHRKHRVYLQVVKVATIPEGSDQRVAEVLRGGFGKLRLFVLDPYDLALSKLEGNSDRDIEDVKYLGAAVPLDLDTLSQRYQEELRPYLGRPEREDLTLQLWREAIEEERSGGV